MARVSPDTARAADEGVACRNLRWALALWDGLAGTGLRRLVFSPGSRSTPLVLAAERREQITLTPIVDERSAAFFALGLARGTGAPVALVATSGSAPSHWWPAVIEASEWGLPLILISADRPPRLRGWGANQTIDQDRLFGGYVRLFRDPGLPSEDPTERKSIRALGSYAGRLAQSSANPGPVHLNLPFDEPLVPRGHCSERPLPGAPPAQPPAIASMIPTDTLSAWTRGRGVIVCGPGDYAQSFPEALAQYAEAHGLPVLLDPLSRLRGTLPPASPTVTQYDGFLRHPGLAEALRPDWVLRFGRTPVSKRLGEWLTDLPMLRVDPRPEPHDPSHDLRLHLTMDPVDFCRGWVGYGSAPVDRDWMADWRSAEDRAAGLAEAHRLATPWCEPHLIAALIHALPDDTGLFVANSLPIRQIDTWSGQPPRPLKVYGNRGVSGIDGQLSTLAGLNAAGQPACGLLGDVAFCHDLSGLFQGERLTRPVIMINNQGGRIFDYLPQRALPTVGPHWHTPPRVDLGRLLEAFGWSYHRVDGGAGFETALATALETPGPGLIEARIDAERSRRVHTAFWEQLRDDPWFSRRAARS